MVNNASMLSDIGPMRHAGAAFLIALMITLLATPVVRRFAIARDLYDRPDTGLKPHQRPIPYLGGVAMHLGWLGAVTYAMVAITDLGSSAIAVMCAGTILMLTGLIDDLVDLRPRTKLAMQGLTAAVLIFGGIGRTLALVLLHPLQKWLPAGASTDPIVFGLSGMLVAAILLTTTNATNLIDGLDGLCGGIMGIAAAGYLVLTVAIDQGTGKSILSVIMAAALAGICLGFLAYNRHPASIFMGDSGSLLLGFNAAVLIILIGETHSPALLAGAVMVFAFPICDTGLAVVRRWINGKPLFRGDRSHLYDQLRDRGWSVRRTVGVCYLLGLLYAVLGTCALILPGSALAVLYAALIVLTGLVFRQLGMVRVDDAAERSKSAGP